MAEFSGRTVLVTGGSSGIGLATAQAFAAQGARVMVTGRDVRTLGKAKAVLGDAVRVIRSDASKRADAIALAESLAQDHI
ncbi:MAG: SDR family NAD(P)-dependent oxidoreductase, partial [Nevskia sp.]|nr:SDR family NAD(P)-dependent oxidoreductase [Nevskia sp.]